MSQRPRDVGAARTAPSRRSSTGVCSTPPRASSASARGGYRTRRCSSCCGGLFEHHGYLSGLIIDEAEGCPRAAPTGTASAACCGPTSWSASRRTGTTATSRSTARCAPCIPTSSPTSIAGIRSRGGQVSRIPATDLLTINGEFTASRSCWPAARRPASGTLRWQVRFDTSCSPTSPSPFGWHRANREALDYYLLPRLDMNLPQLRLA